jgi:hypothetical protein
MAESLHVPEVRELDLDALNLIPLGSCVDVRALLGPGLGLGLNSEYYYL